MVRSERSWARTFVRRGLVAAIMVLALAVYGLVTAGTQSLALRPTAAPTSGGHSVSQAVSDANGSINVAAQGPNHTTYFYWELEDSSGNYTGVWHGPLGIGAPGSTFSAPTIITQAANGPGYGNFDIAVEGPNHTGDLYWDISGTWYGPYQFAGPGTVFGTPGMVEDSHGNLQIGVQGPGNTLYVYWNATGTFYGPLGIGGPNSTFSAPAMSTSGDYVHATVQGRNHDLEDYDVYDGGNTPSNATPWSSPFDISNDNTAWDSAWGGSEGAIFQGPSNSLYQAANFFAIDLTQIRGAGTTYSTPSALFAGQFITAEGPSNTLYWYFFDVNTGRVDGPLQIGGIGSTWSAPSLIEDDNDNFDIAVQGANHTLYEYFVINGVVHGPLGIGAMGSTFSSPN
jgi:hypothetical protein